MVADYRREESTFRGAVLMVQEQGDQVRQRANHEAQVILNQARVQAAEVIAGARAQARNVEQQIEQLEQRQSQLHATLGTAISDLQSVLAKTPHHPNADGKRRQDPPDALSGRPPMSHSAAASEIAQPGPSNMKSASAAKNGDDTKDDTKTKQDEKQNHANDRGRLGTRLAAVTSVGVSTGKWGSAAAESKSETVDSIEQIQTILKGVDTFLIKIPGLPDE
jgi:cell division septum initiation protein DivIVA